MPHRSDESPGVEVWSRVADRSPGSSLIPDQQPVICPKDLMCQPPRTNNSWHDLRKAGTTRRSPNLCAATDR